MAWKLPGQSTEKKISSLCSVIFIFLLNFFYFFNSDHACLHKLILCEKKKT